MTEKRAAQLLRYNSFPIAGRAPLNADGSYGTMTPTVVRQLVALGYLRSKTVHRRSWGDVHVTWITITAKGRRLSGR